MKGRRRPDDREDVGVIFLIGGHHRGDDLNLGFVPLGKQRANRTIGQPRSENCCLGWPSFTLDKSARNLSGGVHSLFVIDRQREERHRVVRFSLPNDGRQHVVSPYLTTTAPSACWAMRPVSSESVRPESSISTRVTLGKLPSVIRIPSLYIGHRGFTMNCRWFARRGSASAAKDGWRDRPPASCHIPNITSTDTVTQANDRAARIARLP